MHARIPTGFITIQDNTVTPITTPVGKQVTIYELLFSSPILKIHGTKFKKNDNNTYTTSSGNTYALDTVHQFILTKTLNETNLF